MVSHKIPCFLESGLGFFVRLVKGEKMVHTKTSHHDRVDVFLEKYREPLPESLAALEKKALAENVPIIRSGTRDMLRFLLRTQKPKSVLEIGTAVGFSALCMREYLPASSHITTIEKVEMRLKEARKNLKKFDKDDRITLLEGDAADVLKELLTKDNTYDLIFMDAAKGQYLNFLPDVMSLLSVGGLLVSDNIFHDGDVLESRYAVLRRDRTIHGRMREYLQVLYENEKLETTCLPIGDGLTISKKMER